MIWRIATGIGLVGLVAGITVLSLWMLGVDLGGETKAQQENGLHLADNSFLLTDNREALEVCVEFVNVDASSEEGQRALDNIREAVDQIAKHPSWSLTDDPTDVGETALVDAGCPLGVPPAGLERFGLPIDNILGHRVDSPSRYRLFLFVMPDDEAAAFAGDDEHNWAIQEYTCQGDVCAGVSSGVYLGLSQATLKELEETLAKAVGLE
jgi:hypothetical protein